MNWFDQPIIHFLNSFAHRSWIADAIIVEIGDSDFLDGAVLMAMVWWAWVEFGKKYPEKRETLLANLGVCALAVISARFLALSLPYRDRPFSNPLLHFQMPYSAGYPTLIHWSSFPSDHAVLAFCIATGLWLVSRGLGTVALAYAFAINLPRVYSGAHYPTDFVAGAVLGSAMAFLSITPVFRNAARICLKFLDPHPAYLYAILFAWTFEVGEMFDSLRHIAVLSAKGAMQAPPSELQAVAIPLLVVLTSLLVWIRWRRRKSTAST